MTQDEQLWEDVQEAFMRDAIANGIGIFIAMHKNGKTMYKLVQPSEFEQFAEFLLEYPKLAKERGLK
jgi:hypothetical protein